MADYEGRIRLSVQGLPQVLSASGALESAADNADRLSGTSIRLRVSGAETLGKLANQMSAIETRALSLASAVSRIGGNAATVRLNAKIDRKSINNELDLISRQFQRRNWRLNVNDTSVKTARVQVERLGDDLRRLVSKQYTINVEYDYRNPPGGGRAGGRPPVPPSGPKAPSGASPEDIARRAGEAMAGGLTGKLYSDAVAGARQSAARQGLTERFRERVQRPQSPGGINQSLAQRYIKALGGNTPKGMSPQGMVVEVERLLREVDESVIKNITGRIDGLKLSMQMPRNMRPVSRGLPTLSAAYTQSSQPYMEPNWNELMDRMAAVTRTPAASSRRLRALPRNMVTTDLAGLATDQAAGVFGDFDLLGGEIRNLGREAGLAFSPLERISDALRDAGSFASGVVDRLRQSLGQGNSGGGSGAGGDGRGGQGGGSGGGFTPFGLLPPAGPPFRREQRRPVSASLNDSRLMAQVSYEALGGTSADERRRGQFAATMDAYIRSLINAEQAQRSLNSDIASARQAIQNARRRYVEAGATQTLTRDEVRGVRSDIVRERRAGFSLAQRRAADRIDELESGRAPIEVFRNYGELRGLYGQLPITQRRSALRNLSSTRRDAARDVISETAIGGAFPLLFGQGPATSIGGAVGGAASLFGPGAGFAGGLVGSAIGMQVDALTKNLGDLASSLKSPTDAITALETSGFRVSDSLKFQVQQLQS
ncbi:MAG: hypothetical protein ACK41W_11600, partial [Cyanobacteriota bacterium]